MSVRLILHKHLYIPKQFVNNTMIINELSKMFSQSQFQNEKELYSPYLNNYNLIIKNTYYNKLYNVDTKDYYKFHMNKYENDFYIMCKDIYSKYGSIKEITLDIYNDNNELLGYVKQTIHLDNENR